MSSLTAIGPDWFGVVHRNGECGERGRIWIDKHAGGRYALAKARRRKNKGSMTHNPESKPTWPLVEVDESIWQGAAKLDWVAVWFFTWNSNVIVSPGWAVMFAGWKVRPPVPPTITLWSCEVDEVAVEEAGETMLDTVEEVVDGATEDTEPTAALPMAAAWKAANWVPGLTAKTMPCWQWLAWRQNIQMGFKSKTLSWACWKGPLVLFGNTGTLTKKSDLC
jgi:hypothetical protein